MVKAVFFDIDGTLLEANEFVYSAFEEILAQFNFRKVRREEMAKLMGKDLTYIYECFAPGCDPQMLSKAHIEYQRKNLYLSVPFPKSVETLKKLKENGLKIAAITSRSSKTSTKTLDIALLSQYIDLVISLEDVLNPKPHPEPILKALQYFNIASNEAFMIGDTAADIVAGKAAGVKTIGVTYGMLGREISASKPDFIIHTISEILPIVLS